MQNLSIKSFLGGALFASFLLTALVFAFNYESRIPNRPEWDPRFDVYEAAVTENRRLFDTETNRTIVWTPGNPKTNVVEVKELAPGRWQVILEKVYWSVIRGFDFVWDDAERLSRIVNSSDSTTITFGYDNEDKVTSRAYPNGVTTTYSYFDNDLLKRITDANSSTTLFDGWQRSLRDFTPNIFEVPDNPYATNSQVGSAMLWDTAGLMDPTGLTGGIDAYTGLDNGRGGWRGFADYAVDSSFVLTPNMGSLIKRFY